MDAEAVLEYGVRGPKGQLGISLAAPSLPALEWDIEGEIASTARFRLQGEGEWWIAYPYLDTLRRILARFPTLTIRVAGH